jgi:exodeoxyribonuclease VII small subunit
MDKVTGVPSEPAGRGHDELPGGTAVEIDALTYEQARIALDEVVTRLESSTVSLEHSVLLWERGNALADICQKYLDGARERIEAGRPPVG